MVTTPDLIDEICASATPVRRLRPPPLRAVLWLLSAGVVVVLLAAVRGIRPGLALLLEEPGFAAALAGSLLTGALAAVAAFELSLPDRSRLWLLLPAPALMLWISTIGYGCLTDWVDLEPDGVRLGSTLECFATLVLVSLPPAAVLAAMLRRSAWLDPTPAAMSGGLAIGGIAATAMSLLHDLDATVLVLVWTLGATGLIVALGGLLGRRILART
ncbi:MAG: NrsF family protein [Geminicoccaceae bacterium]